MAIMCWRKGAFACRSSSRLSEFDQHKRPKKRPAGPKASSDDDNAENEEQEKADEDDEDEDFRDTAGRARDAPKAQ